METISTPSSVHSPKPVDTSERLVILDIIRGFALGGVFFSNVYMWFSGRFLMPPSYWKTYVSSGWSDAIDHVFAHLVFGKFITIFTFLFGLGLAMQFTRAEDQDASPARRYLRRASVMVLFGAAHTVLLWYGDILHIYALLGLGLLLVRRASTKTLLIVGSLLTLLVLPISVWLKVFLPMLWSSPEDTRQAMQVTQAQIAATNEQILAQFMSGSYLSHIRANLLTYWRHFLHPQVIAFDLGMFGNFLLGFAAGRASIFSDIEKHRRLFRHLFGWGLCAGIVAGAAAVFLRMVGPGKTFFTTNEILVPLFMPLARNVQTIGLAGFYIATITLLFQRGWAQRLLSIFAPVGRTAVTNYLLQSVVSVMVFSGLGLKLIGNFSPLATFCMPAVVFALQMVCSRYWLQFFRFGPVEWVWRSLSYGKMLPIRRTGERVGEGVDG